MDVKNIEINCINLKITEYFIYRWIKEVAIEGNVQWKEKVIEYRPKVGNLIVAHPLVHYHPARVSIKPDHKLNI